MKLYSWVVVVVVVEFFLSFPGLPSSLLLPPAAAGLSFPSLPPLMMLSRDTRSAKGADRSGIPSRPYGKYGRKKKLVLTSQYPINFYPIVFLKSFLYDF